jgi:hypothetical protein
MAGSRAIVRRNNPIEEGLMTQSTSTRQTWAMGLTVFAATFMIISGVLSAIQGIVALANSEFYVVGRKYTFQFDVTAWGWIQLLIGIVVAAVGVFLVMGQTWARWTALVVVALSMIANFAWLPYYPVWGIIVLALDGAVIWALTVVTHEQI